MLFVLASHYARTWLCQKQHGTINGLAREVGAIMEKFKKLLYSIDYKWSCYKSTVY